MSVSAIILAAGQGTRMNAQQNKVFMLLGGHSILSYSLKAFGEAENINDIIVVYASGEEERIANCIEEAKTAIDVRTVAGGELRQHSVQHGLALVRPGTSHVAIHDGARPLITADFIEQLVKKAVVKEAVIPALPVKDTIKQVQNNVVKNTLKRSELYRIQTPQVFNLELFRRYQDCPVTVTDDASLIEKNAPVYIHEGSPFNIKITTPEDLWFAEAVLRKVEDYKW